MCRTIEELKNGKKEFSQVHPPLLNIPLDHVAVDERHMLLHITDVLERNIVLELHQWDVKEGNYAPASGQHCKSLIQCCKKAGVTFDMWASKAPGKELEFTSPMGPDKKQLLHLLPDHFAELLHPETAAQVKWLWTEFLQLCLCLSSWEPVARVIPHFQSVPKNAFGSFVMWERFVSATKELM